MYIKEKGIILKKKALNDNDNLYIIFTREYGKIGAIYFGIRKSVKKEKKSTDIFSYTEFVLKSRFNQNTYLLENIIQEATCVNNYFNIRNNIYSLNILTYISYLLDKILMDNKQEEEIFDRLLNMYDFLEKVDRKYLNNKIKMNILLVYYIIRTIDDLGIYNFDEIMSVNNVDDEYKNNIYKSLKFIFKYIKIKNITDDIEIELNKYRNEIRNLIEYLEKYLNVNLQVSIKYNNLIFVGE